jgi:CheY-like chemotaxis protein
MKKVTADFIRQEVTRFGAIVAQTAIFHSCGLKLHSAGDVLGLAHAKALRESFVDELALADFREDPRKALGIQQVPRHQVVPGDVLAEDLRSHRNQILLPAGTSMDADNMGRLQDANVLAVPIRHRQLASITERANAYLSQCPATDSRVKDAGTRVTRVRTESAVGVQYLLIPQAKVLVALEDDLLRVFLVNALNSEGHLVADCKSRTDYIKAIEAERPQVIILDLEGSEHVLPEIREMSDTRIRTVLVCAATGRSAKIHNALVAGANDWMPRPPSRDVLNEKIQGCQGLLGRRVHLPPSLRNERRAIPRVERKGGVGLKDPVLPRPLPVPCADLINASDGGLRVDYNRPAWPCSWAYTGHGVHPDHFWYTYSLENPLGRDLTVNFPGPRNEALERTGRVIHVEPKDEVKDDLEVIGLKFTEPQDTSPGPTPPKRMF